MQNGKLRVCLQDVRKTRAGSERQFKRFGREVHAHVGDVWHPCQGDLDLADAACAIHPLDAHGDIGRRGRCGAGSWRKARVIMSRATTVAVIMIVMSVVVVMVSVIVTVTVMTMVVLVIVAAAAAVIVVACVTVIVIAGAAVVIMTSMGVGALLRRGGNRRRRQLGHVEPKRANLLGDILRHRFARGIA